MHHLTKARKSFHAHVGCSITRQKVHTALFNLTDEIEMGHTSCRARGPPGVAPATRTSGQDGTWPGQGPASTTLLPRTACLIAPAMMCGCGITRRRSAISAIERDGILLVGPNEGDMACGEYGLGRMAEPAEMLRPLKQCWRQGRNRSRAKGWVRRGRRAKPLIRCATFPIILRKQVMPLLPQRWRWG